MARTAYKDMPPRFQAVEDYKNGEGHDANPYNKATHLQQWEEYALEMHRQHAEELKALQQQGRQQMAQGGAV